MGEEKKQVKIPMVVQIIASLWILFFSLMKFFLNGDTDGTEMFTYSIDEVVKSGIGFMLCYMPEIVCNIIEKFMGKK